MGAGVLAKGRAGDSAEEIEELGRELGLAEHAPPPRRRPAAGREPQMSERLDEHLGIGWN